MTDIFPFPDIVDSVNAISLGSSYSATDNYAVLRIEGGFKAGDVVTIAGAINKTDKSKTATADLFTISDGQVKLKNQNKRLKDR